MSTKYQKIIDWVEQEIRSSHLVVGDSVPSEKELSQMFQVSRITAKRALEELAKSDLIVRKVGHGNFVKQNNTTKQKIITMIFPNDNVGNLWSEYANGARYSAEKKGYFITPVFYDYLNPESFRETILRTVHDNVSGFVCYPSDSIHGVETLHELSLKNYPFAVIDKFFYGFTFTSVLSDNTGGARLLADYVVGEGHTKVAAIFFEDIMKRSSTRDRYIAQSEYFQSHGIQEYKTISSFEESQQEQIILELYHSGFTCILCEHDLLANQCAIQIKTLGIQDKIEIVGFDNMEKLLSLPVHITTVSQDFFQIASKAVDLVINKIDLPETENKTVIVPTQLRVK